MSGADHLTVQLTHDEGLVLFELLHRWEDADRVSATLDRAEQVALWSLSAALEKVLSEPLDADFGHLVSMARTRLAPSE